MKRFRIPEDISTIAYAEKDFTINDYNIWFKSDAVIHLSKKCDFPLNLV